MSQSYKTPKKGQDNTLYSAEYNNKSSSHKNSCVCDLCSCSKHLCPPSSISYEPDILRSTMKKDYPAYDIPQSTQKRGKQGYVPTNYSADQMKSTHQTDYTPKKLGPPHRHAQEEFVNNNVPFNGLSEYKHSYLENNGSPSRPLQNKPNQSALTNSSPFTGESTYTHNYTGHPGQKNSQVLPKHQLDTVSPTVPFNATSTYSQEYKKPNLASAQNSRRNIDRPYEVNSVPFVGKTSYQQEYTGYDPRSYQKSKCRVDELPPRPRNCSPGQTHLYYDEQSNQWH